MLIPDPVGPGSITATSFPAPTIQVCVPVKGPGNYVVSVRHDINGNGKSDKSDGGGLSGNPDMKLTDFIFKRKPKLAQVSFAVGGPPQPDGGHPAGTVYLGWCSGARSGHVLLQIPGSPEDVVRRTVEEAIETLASLLPGGGPAGAPEGDPARS